jgi:dipeptidyl aminopeptidase/acylaminoacyl peptidase
MDDRRHGEGDLDDCVEAKKYLAATGRVDPNRIGIIGGSYGGYMVLAALAFRPEAFAVGIDIFGVANWLRTLKSTPPWWTSFRAALFAELGDPFKEEVRLRRISPLFHADKIRRPLLVLQGANDPRVLKVESDEMVAAVRKNNVPVEYIVFDDEGHGFVKKQNEVKGNGAILEFLNRHLK